MKKKLIKALAFLGASALAVLVGIIAFLGLRGNKSQGLAAMIKNLTSGQAKKIEATKQELETGSVLSEADKKQALAAADSAAAAATASVEKKNNEELANAKAEIEKQTASLESDPSALAAALTRKSKPRKKR